MKKLILFMMATGLVNLLPSETLASNITLQQMMQDSVEGPVFLTEHFLIAICYMSGIGFLFAAYYAYKIRTTRRLPGPISTCITYIILGMALILIPIILHLVYGQRF